MKAILRSLTSMFTNHCIKTYRVATIFIAIAATCMQVTAQTIKWTGDGSGAINLLASTDFNTATNWDLLRVPGTTDSVVIILTQNKASNINLSASTTIKNLTLIVPFNNNNNQQVYLNVGAYTLTISGKSSVDLQDNQPNNLSSV